MTGGYRFLDHMTDAAIEASGSTMDEAFENAAMALVDTMVEIQNVESRSEIAISASGRDLETLLFDWLDKVLLILLVDHFVMRHFRPTIHREPDRFLLEATAYGEAFDFQRHRYKVEVKGITFHEMEIRQRSNGVTLKFLLDL